jgi:hypothetical protein
VPPTPTSPGVQHSLSQSYSLAYHQWARRIRGIAMGHTVRVSCYFPYFASIPVVSLRLDCEPTSAFSLPTSLPPFFFPSIPHSPSFPVPPALLYSVFPPPRSAVSHLHPSPLSVYRLPLSMPPPSRLPPSLLSIPPPPLITNTLFSSNLLLAVRASTTCGNTRRRCTRTRRR